MSDQGVSAERISSGVSAATLLTVGLTVFLPYMTGWTGMPLANPIWSSVFGLFPTAIGLLGLDWLVVLSALLSPLIILALIAFLLAHSSQKISTAGHIAIWLSLLAIAPMETTFNWSWLWPFSIHRYFMM